MSIAELPECVHTAPGFDPSRRWWPIVCTGNRTHAFTVLGIAYERDEWRTWHVTGPHIGTAQRVDRAGNPNGAIHAELQVREAGSVPVRCPTCPWTGRYPLVKWAGMTGRLAHRDPSAPGEPPWLDLSLR